MIEVIIYILFYPVIYIWFYNTGIPILTMEVWDIVITIGPITSFGLCIVSWYYIYRAIKYIMKYHYFLHTNDIIDDEI